MEALGRENILLRQEISDLKVKLSNQEIELKKEEAKMKAEFLANIEKLSRECSVLRKEKETIVIRYANSEKEVMDKKIQQDLCEKCDQEKCDQEQVHILLRQELDALKRKQRLTMDDNNSLTLKLNSLEKESLEYEQTLCNLKDNQNLLKEEIAGLISGLTEMEGLKLQLQQEREKSAASLCEVARLRLTNYKLQADLDAFYVKEGDRLDFVEKLTAKTMLLQSDHCLSEIKGVVLEEEVNNLEKSLADVQQKYMKLVGEFEGSKKEHERETQLLAQNLAEKAENGLEYSTILEVTSLHKFP